MPAVHNVIRVRIEQAGDGSHRHVTGVWVQENDDGPPYTLRQVAESIREGEIWQARVDGKPADVQAAAGCPHPGCDLQPYLAIRDGSGEDLLERMRA